MPTITNTDTKSKAGLGYIAYNININKNGETSQMWEYIHAYGPNYSKC